MKIAYRMVAASLFAAACFAQVRTKETKAGTSSSAVRRPAIVGVAHIALKTDNLDAARKFYSGVLGFQEPFSYSEEGHLLLTYFKVNDHQYIEVFPSLKDQKEDRLSHISFELPTPNGSEPIWPAVALKFRTNWSPWAMAIAASMLLIRTVMMLSS